MSGGDITSNLIHEWTRYRSTHSPMEVGAMSKHLRSIVWRHRLRSLVPILLPIILLVALVVTLFQNEAFSETFYTFLRLFVVHVVYRVIDLPRLGRADCIISNPYFDKSMILANPDDCLRCTGLRRAVTIDANNFKRSDFIYSISDQDTPVVMRDGVKNWGLSSMNVQSLHDLYVHDPSLRRTLPCNLHSNIELPYPNNKLLLKMLLDRKPGRWFAMWEHCTSNQSKTLRQFYKRPDYLPDTLGFGDQLNWLILGQNPDPIEEPIPLLHRSGYAFLGQAKGQMRVKLEPKEPCLEERRCRVINLILNEGDLLIVTGLWYLRVMPNGSAFSLALAFLADA